METIDMLINEIESEVLKAKKAAFSNTDIVINKAVLLDLISRFRASYPLVCVRQRKSRRSATTS